MDGFFFLPRRTGDRLVLKWWMIALRNCRVFSLSVIRKKKSRNRRAERCLGSGPVPGMSVWYSLRSVRGPHRRCCSTVSADGGSSPAD